MSDKTFSFKKQLDIGHIGETLYYLANHTKLDRTDGRKGDYIDRTTGAIVELKTDSYSMASTPNFCIEVLSDKHKEKPGGPYQALIHGCIYYKYLYIKDMTVFTFNTKQLIETIEQTKESYRKIEVRNAGWITTCLLVPREDLSDICTRNTIHVTMGEETVGPKYEG